MSQFFASGGQSIATSASASILPMNTQDWFLLRLTGLIYLQSKEFSRVFSNTTIQKHQFFSAQLSLWSNSHPYMTTGKSISLTRWTFVVKVMSLLFNMLSKLVVAFLPRSKCLLISRPQSPPSAVILEPPEIKSLTVSIVSPSICHEVMASLTWWTWVWVNSRSWWWTGRPGHAAVHGVTKSQTQLNNWTELMGPDVMILVFWILSFKPTFSTLLSHFHQEAL